MPKWPSAVFFDFDGVLVNSEPLHFRAFRDVLASEHVDLSEEEYYCELIGFDDKGAFRHLYQKRNLSLPPKLFLSLMARKGRAIMQSIQQRRVEALPGVEQFVRALWRQRPLAICSGGLREEIEAMLEGVSLRDCFSVIVAAEDVPVGKPDPRGYLLTMRLLAEKSRQALRPGDCLIIEDAPTVIRRVREAGFSVLGVATSYSIDKLADANWAVKSLELDEVWKMVPQLRLLLQT